MEKKIHALLGAVLAAVSIPWATPISASMSAQVQAGIGPTTNSGVDNAAWGVPASPLSVSAAASVAPPNCGTAGSFANASSAWGADGNSGSVTMNYGWNVSALCGDFSVATNQGAPNWSYTFTADAAGDFLMDYNVSATGNTFGLQGFMIDYADLSGGTSGTLNLTNAFDPSATGQFVLGLTAGDEYRVQLVNEGNLSGGAGTWIGSAQSQFNWTLPNAPLAAIPEPGTLALCLFGFGSVAGLAARKSRRA